MDKTLEILSKTNHKKQTIVMNLNDSSVCHWADPVKHLGVLEGYFDSGD